MAPRHETAGSAVFVSVCVCEGGSMSEFLVCVSGALVWVSCVCLVGEGGVVPLQLLLSAGPLLVLRLAALLVFAAL